METYIASFDIGKKNFAFCIERINPEHLQQIENIPLSKRYNPDGTCTDDMQSVLDQVYSNGEIVLYKNLDLTYDCKTDKKLEIQIFYNMTEELNFFTKYWEKCDYFLIEQQMAFGKKMNLMAVKLAQHCYSYFSIFHKGKEIIEFPAYNKTQILGAEKVKGKAYKSGKVRYKAMEKPKRKKWAIEKAMEIFERRDDISVVEKILDSKKKDDLADTFLQIQAWKYMHFVDKVEI